VSLTVVPLLPSIVTAGCAKHRVGLRAMGPQGDTVETKYTDRITHLRNECASPAFLSELFGIPWPPGGAFPEDFRKWQNQRSLRDRCEDGQQSRWLAEFFMQDHRLEPLPWTAAALGVSPNSLKQLLPLLPKAGLRRAYELYPGLLDKSLNEDLVRSLKGLRFRTFGTHNSFCTILHGALRDATGMQPEPWYCWTSLKLGEYERQFASVVDSITGEGLSVKHSVWLNLGKPLRLAPDRCSKLFYAQHHDEMRGMLAGRGEPDDLPAYLQWLAEQRTGGHG
jgi:hypothetical protein